MPALDGLRILDMTQFEAGTSCTQALAWLGADVVKIESKMGDPGRGVGADSSYSAYFCNWNANKRSLVLDLTTQRGRELLLEMLPNFDVFVENFGPGVIEKLNLTYEDLRRVHPTLIYARLKGFGTFGPYSEFKSFDPIAQCAAGAASITGFPDGPPVCPGTTTGDAGTGLQLALSILAAYVQRQRTGNGQEIEISMQEAMTYFVRTRISFLQTWGREPSPRTGNALGPPTDMYPCKPFGPNDHCQILIVNNKQWDALCMAIERLDLVADPRFKTGEARVENGAALFEEICKWTREHTKREMMAILGAAGVPCSAVLDTQEVHDDPHLNARGFVHTIEHPEHGNGRLLGFAPRMSDSEVRIQRAPLLGEHSEEVLEQELGLTTAEFAELCDAGVSLPAQTS